MHSHVSPLTFTCLNCFLTSLALSLLTGRILSGNFFSLFTSQSSTLYAEFRTFSTVQSAHSNFLSSFAMSAVTWQFVGGHYVACDFILLRARSFDYIHPEVVGIRPQVVCLLLKVIFLISKVIVSYLRVVRCVGSWYWLIVGVSNWCCSSWWCSIKVIWVSNEHIFSILRLFKCIQPKVFCLLPQVAYLQSRSIRLFPKVISLWFVVMQFLSSWYRLIVVASG